MKSQYIVFKYFTESILSTAVFLFLLSSCAHFVGEKDSNNKYILHVEGIHIQDDLLIKEEISSKDKIVKRNEHTYKSGQSLHEELEDLEETFQIKKSNIKSLDITYKQKNKRPAWKAISLITLAIIPYWETVEVKYTIQYIEGGIGKEYSKNYTYRSVYSALIIPISFAYSERDARKEIAKIAVKDFQMHLKKH